MPLHYVIFCGLPNIVKFLIVKCSCDVNARGFNDETPLAEDKVIATKIKQLRGFSDLGVNTWEQVLKKNGDIPNGYIFRSEVLVGSRPRALHHGDHVP
jgi:hypothetical protein